MHDAPPLKMLAARCASNIVSPSCLSDWMTGYRFRIGSPKALSNASILLTAH